MSDKRFIMKQGEDEFIIGYFGADLYWIMSNYHEGNKFTITKEQATLYEGLQTMFRFMKMRQEPQLTDNVFKWLSEAGQPEESKHMTITKQRGKFIVEFFQNPNDYISAAHKTCAICFCLSGSRNPSIATMFSAMTHKLLARDN
ncbi:MAG: hypothetical protein IJ272_06665 [Clostridia bacterium]|nr:hypothetical protein [Clostridia bacterium]